MTVTQVIIDNPAINSTFAEPTRHLHSTDGGITCECIESQWVSSHVVPIARPGRTLGSSPSKPSDLILAVMGERKDDKAATARALGAAGE